MEVKKLMLNDSRAHIKLCIILFFAKVLEAMQYAAKNINLKMLITCILHRCFDIDVSLICIKFLLNTKSDFFFPYFDLHLLQQG